jgi:UDP-2,4-diacetamido-2,4,6-trideoxy-beta-L-altropyranose hydrolase
MRCLTLAHTLKQHGWLVTFICRQHPGSCHAMIYEQGFHLLTLDSTETDALQGYNKWLGVSQLEDARLCRSLLQTETRFDLCIVDHYGLDREWQSAMAGVYDQLLVIDDLANRHHQCDYLLDQTLGRQPDEYRALAPSSCNIITGKPYMLLRQEFAELRPLAMKNRIQSGPISDILVAMGGNDPDNVCAKVLSGIDFFRQQTGAELTVTVMTTSFAKHVDTIASQANTLPWLSVAVDCRQVADLLLNADLAIGASGSGAWERCCMGLPTLSVINAENQAWIDATLAEHGACVSLGRHQHINDETISSALEGISSDQDAYRDMIRSCFDVCDGTGAERVAALIQEHTHAP